MYFGSVMSMHLSGERTSVIRICSWPASQGRLRRKTGVLTEEAEAELALTVVEVDCIDISGYILFIGILAYNLNKI